MTDVDAGTIITTETITSIEHRILAGTGNCKLHFDRNNLLIAETDKRRPLEMT